MTDSGPMSVPWQHQRLQDVEARLRELQSVRDVLAELVKQCSGHGSIAGCPIMETVIAGNQTLP